MDERLESFEEFWPFYVREHQKKLTRQLHFIGTTAAIGCLAAGLVTRSKLLLLMAPIAGYGPAWVSHFLIEKNKPASFQYPLWSLAADLLMWSKTIAGTMEDEIMAVMEAERASTPPPARPNTRSDGTLN